MRSLLLAGEILAAATLILLIAEIGAAAVARAGLRHLVRLGGFLTLLLLPFAALLPSFLVLSAAPMAAGAAVRLPDDGPHAVSWILLLAAALWVGGTVLLLARGLAGAWSLARLNRQSRPHDFDSRRLAAWASRAGISGRWSLRLSAATRTPLSFGILRPAVILPEECAAWEPAALDAVMLHELAHLGRRDALAQALSLICAALYWPHPLVWRQARALRADAEKAADDAVIRSGVRPSAYAALLVSVAAERASGRAFAGLEAAIAGPDGLEARIKAVLAPDILRTGVTRMQTLKTVSFGIGAALLFALCRPTLAADPAPPQPLPMPQAAEDRPAATTATPPPPAPPPADAPEPAKRPPRKSHMAADRIDEVVARAIASAHIDQKIADAHIGEKIAAAIASAHIDQKIADAHIGEKVAAALAKANIDKKIDEALAKADIDRKIDEALKKLDEKDAGATVEDAPK